MSVEPRWPVPRGWEWTSIDSIADITGGGTPSANDPLNFSDVGGTPWITPADLTGYEKIYIERGRRNLSERGYKNSAAKVLPAGAVLFTSRAPIGYCAIAANPIATNQGFKSLTLFGGISGKYTRQYLKWSKPFLESLASGTTFLELSGSKLQQVPFPLPPLSEQKRIVAKLDALNAKSARARTELARIETLVSRYKQAVLSKAFSGELTREWRGLCGPKTVDDIADLIAEERATMRNSRGLSREGSNRSVPPHSAVLGFIPDNWNWLNFGQCSYELTVGHVGPMKDRYVNSGIPFLRSLNVKANSIDLRHLAFIDKEFHGELKKSSLRPGDLVVVRTGEPGVAAVVPADLETANCSDLVICRLVSSIYPHYAAFYMNSNFARSTVGDMQVGVAQQHFNVGAMGKMPVPVPPLEEQHEIVRRIESAFAKIDRLATQAKRALELVGKLDEAILAKAFRGELVPQDENDEPASALLARIRAEREAAPKAKRGRRAKA